MTTETTTDLQHLSPADVGRTVTVRSHDGTAITGPLRGVSTETDWITDVELGQNPDDAAPMPGQMTVTVYVGPWTCSSLPPTTPVTVHS